MKLLTLCFSLLMGFTFAAQLETHQENTSAIRVVPVEPTPEGDNVQLISVFPVDNQIVDSSPVELQLRLNGYPLASMSDFERRKEVRDDPNGQSVRVFIDDQPFFSIYEAFVDNLDDNNLYFEQTLFEKIPYSLKPGKHIVRAFPVRSYGESLKDEGTFQAFVFYYKTKKGNDLKVDLDQPYITYNEPQGSFKANQPILLDFYLTGTQLSRDGYKVKLIIDDQIERIITNWQPYYIYGLSKGRHTIELQLLNPMNKIISSAFNDVKKQITIR